MSNKSPGQVARRVRREEEQRDIQQASSGAARILEMFSKRNSTSGWIRNDKDNALYQLNHDLKGKRRVRSGIYCRMQVICRAAIKKAAATRVYVVGFGIPVLLIYGLVSCTLALRDHITRREQQREREVAQMMAENAAKAAAYVAAQNDPNREIDSSSRGIDWRVASPEAKDRYLKSYTTSAADQKFLRSGLDALYDTPDFEINKLKLEDARSLIERRGR